MGTQSNDRAYYVRNDRHHLLYMQGRLILSILYCGSRRPGRRDATIVESVGQSINVNAVIFRFVPMIMQIEINLLLESFPSMVGIHLPG